MGNQRGSAPGERRGGRQIGTLNKRTLEKLAIAERTVADAKASGKKLAKEVLDEFMHLFAGMAAYHQPTPVTAPQQNPNADESKFKEYAMLAVSTASDLAKYQSPTFKAIVGPFAPSAPGADRTLELAPNPPAGENVRALSTDPEVLQQIYRRRIAQVG